MLINCVAYEEGRKLADIDKREISDYLARPGCFVWVALLDATEAELEEMREEFDLHELAVEDARVGHQRPKIEEYGNSLFVVLRTIEVVGDELKLGEVDIFAGPNYVLSVRHATERGFKEVRARCEKLAEIAPEEITARLTAADTWRLAGDLPQAIRAVQALYDERPHDREVIQRLASLLTGEIGDLITPMTRSLSPTDQKRLSMLLNKVFE